LKLELANRLQELVENWTEVDGLRMFGRTSSAALSIGADPIVLVHGYGVSGSYLMPTAEQLCPDFQVLVPDLPGSGQSAKPPEILDVAALAEVLMSWMRLQGVTRATLLGNSFGCQVIVEAALRYPHHVSRLVLVGPTVDPATRSVPKLIWLLARDALRERPLQIVIAARDYLRFGLRRGVATMRFMLEDPIVEKLSRVPVPALVVRGEHDPIVSQAWVEQIVELLPDGELVVIPGAAHAVNFEEPDKLGSVVRQFLADQAGMR
jgi:pimeloyl-ACP methyl ester carboxylesterase